MPITKRTAKVVYYNEQDDDDDFIPIVDNNKKTRTSKKPDEKSSKHEEKEPELILKHSEGTTIENPITIDDKENSDSQSSNESKTSPEKVTEIEDSSPKCKRMKYEEETVRLSDHPTKAPLGFPTSKINIPSPHVSRVGLSRKSSTIKPLHPNFTSRVVPE